MSDKIPYDISKLFTELDWQEIKNRVENFEYFEFIREDKALKIKIDIDARFCDNGIWKDNYICAIGSQRLSGGYRGGGSPYQRDEFLKLTYDKVADSLCQFAELERKGGGQLSFFSLLEPPKPKKKAEAEM